MWVETILFRSNSDGIKDAHEKLKDWLNSVKQEEHMESILILKRFPDLGDLVVELKWNNSDVQEVSKLGLMISRFLEKFGSVHHTSWSQTDAFRFAGADAGDTERKNK